MWPWPVINSYYKKMSTVHLCPILTGLIICVLFSQGKTFVSYSHRAQLLCPVLRGHKFCILFSQGTTFVSYYHRAQFLCPILTGMNKCVLFSLFAGVCPISGVHVPLSSLSWKSILDVYRSLQKNVIYVLF